MSASPLRARHRIETLGDGEPLTIVPIIQAPGSVSAPGDGMAARVCWAERAQSTRLTRNVLRAFAPYNAIIRISERGTEDRQRDSLAHVVSKREARQ